MNQVLPIVYLARHGETAWTLSGQHTGLTDLPLTERGERNARRLEERLRGLSFAKVFTSPLQRARRTCELAGFGAVAEIDPDLVEWNYGEYEGRRTADIHRERPDWQLFRDGCPGGESPSQVGARADRAIKRVRAIEGNVLLFSSGHFLRVLAARWLGLEPGAGRFFLLSTAILAGRIRPAMFSMDARGEFVVPGAPRWPGSAPFSALTQPRICTTRPGWPGRAGGFAASARVEVRSGAAAGFHLPIQSLSLRPVRPVRSGARGHCAREAGRAAVELITWWCAPAPPRCWDTTWAPIRH